jgi:hypothetical protein
MTLEREPDNRGRVLAKLSAKTDVIERRSMVEHARMNIRHTNLDKLEQVTTEDRTAIDGNASMNILTHLEISC